MIIASGFEPFDRDNVFYDLETWDAIFSDTIKNNPDAAYSLARLLYKIIKNIAEGKKGIDRTVNTLKLGVEWIYPYTDAHKTSFQAFLFDLQGLMLSGDFPVELMKGAIDRAIASEARFEAEFAKEDPPRKRNASKRRTSPQRKSWPNRR
ncbi:MAG: hypothetical protein ACREDR_04120 [Blastocatellia bacterium]